MFSKLNSLEDSQLASVARLFSASVFREMAKLGVSPMFARLTRESTLNRNIDSDWSVGDLFDFAFSVVKRKACRYEFAYRAAITQKILLGVHSLKSAAMLTEFRAANCKADVVILNGTSTVYEIKSERDNLDRLERQIEAYKKMFARVNIITAEGHVSSILGKVSADIGVLVLSDRFRISTVREAKESLELIDPKCILDSLQRHEAIKILQILGRRVPDVPNTRMYAALREEFVRISAVDAHKCMLQVLKQTRSLLPLSTLSLQLPVSLRAAIFSTTISEKDHSNLLRAIRTPILEAMQWS
jgi:hypothetical protein